MKLAEEIDPYNEDVGSNLDYVNYEYDSITTNWKDSSEMHFVNFFLKYPIVTNQPIIKSYLDTFVLSTLRYWASMFDTTKKNSNSIKELANFVISKAIQEADTTSTDMALSGNYEFYSVYKILNPFKNIWFIHHAGNEYTGGAHGYYYDVYYTFINNKPIPYIESVISDTATFQKLLVQYLRKQSNIPANMNLSEAGFFVDDDNLPLTNNYFFTKDTFYVCYNPYEIACFANGIQRIGVPMSEAKKLMHKDIAALLQ